MPDDSATGTATVPDAAAKPASRPSGKGRPPAPHNTLGALDAATDGQDRKKVKEKRNEPLNFRVTPEFRRAFKRAAAAQDCKKVELLERIFGEWTARNPV